MRLRFLTVAVLFCSFAVALSPANAPAAGPVMAVGSAVSSALLKFFGKEGAEEAAEYLAKKGGKDMIARVSANAARNGGDDAVEQVAKYVSRHGPDALAALDNAPSVGPVLSALSEIPESQVKSALSRLAAGTTGRELAETVGEHGAKALASELKHPGVGMMLVRTLGDDGAELAGKMTSEQALVLGSYLDDLAKLPAAQRTGLMAMFRTNTDRMATFTGDFLKANPGKSLFTVASTTLILAEPERILGGDEIVFDADGNPIVVSKKGIAGRTIQATGEAVKHVSDGYVKPVFYTALAFIATFFGLWLVLKLWHTHKREKLKTAALQADQAKTIDAKASAAKES